MSTSRAKIFARSLESLGFSTVIRNALIRDEWNRLPRGGEVPLSDWTYSVRRRFYDIRARSLTVGEMIATFGVYPDREKNGHKEVIRESVPFRRFKQKLLDLGLTPQDWPRLAPNLKQSARAQFERASRSKSKMLALSVMLLPMSGVAMRMLEYYFQRPREEITIRHLLSTPQDWWSTRKGRDSTRRHLRDSSSFPVTWNWDADVRKSISGARKRLREVGFRRRDGVFLHEYSEEAHLALMMAELHMSRPRAQEIYNFVKTHSWRIEQ